MAAALMSSSAKPKKRLDAIISEYLAVQAAHASAVTHALRCGDLLIREKTLRPHGQFGKFLAGLPFSDRTARAYMQLASADPAFRRRVAEMPLRDALVEIAERTIKIEPNTPVVPVPSNVIPITSVRTAESVAAAVDVVHVTDLDQVQRLHRAAEDGGPYSDHHEQVAALLLAWSGASPEAREDFIGYKADEVAAVFRKFQQAAKGLA